VSDLDGRCFIRRGDTFVPADFVAQEWMRDLVKDGGEIILTGRKPRNPKHHRWFFAMLRIVCRATGRWEDEDELLDALKLAVGHVRSVETLAGEIIRLPRSIAFAALGQDAFARFVKRCLYVLNVHTGIDPEDLMREVKDAEGFDLPLVRGYSIVPDVETTPDLVDHWSGK
jgi:hypothetical protein